MRALFVAILALSFFLGGCDGCTRPATQRREVSVQPLPQATPGRAVLHGLPGTDGPHELVQGVRGSKSASDAGTVTAHIETATAFDGTEAIAVPSRRVPATASSLLHSLSGSVPRAASVTCSDSATVAQFVHGGNGECRFLVAVVNERPCSIAQTLRAYGVKAETSELQNADALCARSKQHMTVMARRAFESTSASISLLREFPVTHGGCDPTPTHECGYWTIPNVWHSEWCCLPTGKKFEIERRAAATEMLGWYYWANERDPEGTMPRLWWRAQGGVE